MFAVKKKIVLALILVVFAIAVVAIISFSYNTGATSYSNHTFEQKQLYTYHDPIHIDGNADFTSENGVSAGDGSSTNPYIIENWDINASTASGIKIRNIDVYFIIRNCIIHDGKSSEYGGIYFSSVQNGKTENVTSYNNYYGIHLSSSSNNNQITNCTVYNNDYGIMLYHSSDNELRENILKNNTFNFGIYGGLLSYYYQDIDISNTINGKPMYYIIGQSSLIFNETMSIGYLGIVSCNNITVKNLELKDNMQGLLLVNSTYSIVSACEIYNNSKEGIGLYSYSNTNQINACQIYNNSWGIKLYGHCSNNNISTNQIYNNSNVGILIWIYCSNNNITTNQIHNNSNGIRLSYSSNNYITNNIFTNNGIIITGDNLEYYIHNIDTTNLMNSKPLYYFLNQNNLNIDNGDTGQIILVNCTNSVIRDVDISHTDAGIELAFSTYISITDCNVYNNSYGIYLWYSSNNTITNCSVYNNSESGIWLWYSPNNTITNCAIYNNSNKGIILYFSSNNTITNCDVYNDVSGIYLYYSSDSNITNCSVYNNVYGILLFSSSNNCIINCIVYNNYYGIDLYYSSDNNQMTACSVYNNYYDGIELFSSSNNEIHYSNIYNNTAYGINNFNSESQYEVNATYCWWGSANGPEEDSTNPVTANVLYDPWLTEPWEEVTGPVHNINKDTYYNTIQEAIDDADAGNTIEVSAGVYYENIVIDKILTLIGEDRNVTIIDGHGTSKVVSISADWVDISKFVVRNGGYGICVEHSSNNMISNCAIYNHSADGIHLSYSKNIKIVNNIIYDTGGGIDIRQSSNNTISNCTIYNNSLGIYLYLSSNSTVTNCAIYNNTWGIKMHYSSSNKITACLIYSNPYRNIAFSYSSSNTLSNCVIYNSTHGIYLDSSSNNNISKCIIYENSHGILLVSDSSDNTIINCTSYNNNWGIYLYYSSDNKIYYNNFINNTNQSYDSSFNYWDNGAGGNYWDDYNGSDADGDGIGDTPYYIPGGDNKDNYPFMEPNGWEEVSELMPHEPIYISGNDDFTLGNGVVSGSGIESDPYIIEGWDIDAGTASYPSYAGVHIENTDAYFIIRNCTIHDGYEEEVRYNYGIYFYNVTNGKIENVTSYNNSFGIYLYDSLNNNIIDCAIYSNSWYGVYLDCSPNNTITNCVSRNNSDYGIRLYESANTTVTNSTIYNNSCGISLSRSLNCKVENCIVYNHTWFGISVSSQSSNNRIVNCVVYNNSYYGIQISSSSWNVVINCSIYNNSRYGIYSSYSQYNQIANSILYNNTDYNIYLRSSLYDQVTNCVLYNSNYGACLYSCLYDQISECAFYNNRYHGIYFTSSLYNQIANNKIINCSTGVCFYFSFYNQITNCTLNNNSYSGGSFQFSSNNTVTRCNLSANNQGFYLYSSSNNNYIYHNSFVNNTNNAYDECTNYWDCNGEGNYWGNYTGTDNNGDCIGDIPYSISGGNNKDNCPLMHEFTWWDTEAPVISLLSPCNNSVINPNTVLEFDIIDDNLWKASYSMNNGVTHYFSSPYNISTNGWEDGTYNITIYAKDWGMNEISKMFISTIDGTPPTVQIIEGNQIINATSFTMHWGTNATDTQFYEISTDGSHWVNVETNTSYTFINLVEGFNILYVRGIDIVNNAGISSSIIIVVEIPISEDIIQEKEEVNWLLYGSIIIVIFIALILAGIGITWARRVKGRKVLYPQKLKCVYCQETMRITSSDRPLLFQCSKCGGKNVIR